MINLILFVFLESPFQQLTDAFGSPLFWFMLLFFTLIGVAAFRFYVKSENDMSEEELYFDAQLSRKELELISAAKQDNKGPFEDSIIENEITPLRHSYWKVKAQNSKGQIFEFWARIDYKNTSLLDIEWRPNIKKPEEIAV